MQLVVLHPCSSNLCHGRTECQQDLIGVDLIGRRASITLRCSVCGETHRIYPELEFSRKTDSMLLDQALAREDQLKAKMRAIATDLSGPWGPGKIEQLQAALLDHNLEPVALADAPLTPLASSIMAAMEAGVDPGSALKVELEQKDLEIEMLKTMLLGAKVDLRNLLSGEVVDQCGYDPKMNVGAFMQYIDEVLKEKR